MRGTPSLLVKICVNLLGIFESSPRDKIQQAVAGTRARLRIASLACRNPDTPHVRLVKLNFVPRRGFKDPEQIDANLNQKVCRLSFSQSLRSGKRLLWRVDLFGAIDLALHPLWGLGTYLFMKIISWNVNGIRAAQKKGLLEFLKAEDPDLFCLQETKAHKDQLEPILFSPTPDYSSYWSSASRKGYSGVVTYSKKEPLLVEHGIGIEKFDSEGRFIVTHFPDFVLYNVYFPNGASGIERHNFKQEFLKLFHLHLRKQMEAGKKVVLVGDYNIAHKEIDIYDPVRLAKASGFLPEERKWFDGFIDSGFVDTFRFKNPNEKERYSWWSYQELARPANRGWRIDYICVTDNLKAHIKKADILDQQHGSDHCPVVLKM